MRIIKYTLSFVIMLALCQNGLAEGMDSNAKENFKKLSAYSESLLISALENIQDSELDAALQNLDELRKINPKFSLAQLIYADVLMAKSQRINDFGNFYTARYEEIQALRDEALARWNYHQAPIDKKLIPSSLIQLADVQDYALVVDQSRHRMYLFKNSEGVPVYVDDFYITIGKNGAGKIIEGDQKTPLGVYFVTNFISPEELPDLYGSGAFPINYPNVWDKRSGRTGYGIWLHGNPSAVYSRPPEDSDGCVTLSNDDFVVLKPYIDEGQTPVILADKLDWVSKEEWQKRQKSFYSFLDQWRKDWESRDADLYLRHYSKDYQGLGKDYASWAEYKRRVNPSKAYIKVNLFDTSIFLYPNGTDPILVITFKQDYSSDNFQRVYRKRQYWRMEEDGNWRIIYEGSV